MWRLGGRWAVAVMVMRVMMAEWAFPSPMSDAVVVAIMAVRVHAEMWSRGLFHWITASQAGAMVRATRSFWDLVRVEWSETAWGV